MTAAEKARLAARAAYARTHAASDWFRVPGGELRHPDLHDVRVRPDGDGYRVAILDRHRMLDGTIAQTEDGAQLMLGPSPAPCWRWVGHVATLEAALDLAIGALLEGEVRP